ncbi:MAG TPA: MBOAT family O-acyltransferase [Chthoniobacterales bacterium]
MLFSTPFFIFGFLPVFFTLYWFFPARRWILLAGSLVFYAWGEPIFVFVVLGSALLDWLLGQQIAKRGPHARWWVALGVTANLGLLVYAKYTVFAVSNLNGLFTAAGWKTWTVPKIALPVGVSFIVFEKITYVVDLYRKAAPPAKSFLDYLNYVFLFPKLLAGPIIKYHDIANQLSQPTHQYVDVEEGLIRFVKGLSKKVLVADMLAPMVNDVFALPAGALDPGLAWLALLGFTFQIYFDFSGYSDMAIGMARMLGFRLMENFHDPYLATSFTDFWRRWHISLSTWIKEYLYIPLGGNRISAARTYINLCICFLLCGLWHGAAWNFIIWGAIQGAALVCDRAFWLDFSKRLPKLVNIGLTFVAVTMTWVMFRCETVRHAVKFFSALAGAHSTRPNAIFLRTDTLIVLGIAAFLVFVPLARPLRSESFPRQRLIALASAVILLITSAGRITVSAFQPFLYFRF